MKYFFAAFGSRTQAMRYFDMLKRNGIPSTVLNTPREASLGCGLSVRFSPCDFAAAEAVMYKECFSAFIGFFEYDCGKVYRV
ncbi:MAG: DUF3343 domain-containing protein [Firmicutes bacterium]|nr:DUF3343 domain-containing protein [Bacillota bacterium]